jgi:RNA polymerase sigma-70 factor, ECF subfamily
MGWSLMRPGALGALALLPAVSASRLWRKRRQRLHVELGKIDTVQERVRSQIYLSPMMQATPEGEAARSQIRRVLEGAIDDLPPAFRTVLVMLG